MSSSQTSTQVDAALYRLAVDAALGSAMSGIEANDTARLFPDLDELAIKKLFSFLHGGFVVLTVNDRRRLPNVATFEGVNAIRRHISTSHRDVRFTPL